MTTSEEVESEATIQSFRNALRDDTDFTIKLEHFTWRVHTSVLTKKSEFFKRICTGDTWKENVEKTVRLHDDNPFAFARVLQYLYQGGYSYYGDADWVRGPDFTEASARTISVTLDELMISGAYHPSYQTKKQIDSDKHADALDLEVYGLADKYGLPKLRAHGLEQLLLSYGNRGYTDLALLFHDYYPTQVNQDGNLKKTLAACIALKFDRVARDETGYETGVSKWMKDDFERCVMVMKQLKSQGHSA